MIVLAKVKFDLRDPDELYFAGKEIESLLGTDVKLIRTMASLFKERPFNLLDDEVVHIISRLTYLGEGQGYLANMPFIEPISVVKRATFFREIYVIFEAKCIDEAVKTLNDMGINAELGGDSKYDVNPYTQLFIRNLKENGLIITLRFLPFQALFEYVTEVKKLPSVVFQPKNCSSWQSYLKEKEAGIDQGIKELLNHLSKGYYRPPHFGLGKTHIGDFVDWASTDLRKPFLHYLHKYKGKGDPRISRALINLLKVKEGDTVLDPFVGSGAFIADAPTMGINAIGMEILNIGRLIAEVKCNLGINIQELRSSIIKIFELVDKPLFKQNFKEEILELKKKMTEGTESNFKRIEPYLNEILFLKKLIEEIESEEVKKFLLVLLSQKIVEFSEKSRSGSFISSFKSYVEDRYLTLYSTIKMAEMLNVDLNGGSVKIIKGDSTNMFMIEDDSIDGILTSPPYFDALDYIGNNKIPMLLLDLDDCIKYKSTKDFYENYSGLSIDLPASALNLIEKIQKSKRLHKAKTVENYLKMMRLSFEECYRVLKRNKYYIMVVSKYHSWVMNGKEELVETSPILADIGKSVGFKLVDVIEHGLSKADKGKINSEDILIFQK